jgi:hypothetical protein
VTVFTKLVPSPRDYARNGAPRRWLGDSRDLTIIGQQRDDDGQNKLLQINDSKDNSSFIINRMNLIQLKLKTWVLWLGRVLLNPVWSCSCCGLKCSRCIKMWNLCFGVVNRARTMSKLFIYLNYSIIFNDLLYW